MRDWSPWPALALRRGLTAKPTEEFIFPILAEGAADIKRNGGYTPAGAHGEQDGLGTHWEVWSYAMALTPMEALEAASLDGAHFLGLDHELGSITVGKLADLVVLAEDVSRVPAERLRHVGVALTVLGGEVVYSAR